MTQVIVSGLASGDQAYILRDLTAKAGGRTATKYESLFARLFSILADFPGIGARALGWGRGYASESCCHISSSTGTTRAPIP